MLYLEDYLEMIEHLPQELRDRFTEMREMDLSIQNNMDTLDKKVHTLFSQCRRSEIQTSVADTEFMDIRNEYRGLLTDADEKVQYSNQMFDLVDRYLRRLDTELYKFKCELEADHNGITEILEKRSLELDSGNGHSLKGSAMQKENRYFGSVSVSGSGPIVTTPTTHSVPSESRYRTPKQEKRRDSTNALLTPILSAGSVGLGAPAEKRPALASSLSLPTMQRSDGTQSSSSAALLSGASSNQSTVSSSSSSMFGAGSAIVAAASQAIVATQQMQQGRRTASLKASFEAIHGGSAVASSGSHDLLLGAAMQAVDRESSSFSNQQQRKHKKKISSTSHGLGSSSNIGIANASSSSGNSLSGNNSLGMLSATSSGLSSHLSQQSSALDSPSILDSGMGVETATDSEWPYDLDPNEPRYCICNQVSYGDMVACDNEDCPYEWFHYPCVGITSSPKGKWYCPNCSKTCRRSNKK